MHLDIKNIRTDGGTQPRAQMNLFTVDEYRDAWRDGVLFPPVVVFYDGSDYWLADGFHRVQGARDAGLDSIPAEVKQGTRRNAILYAAGANAEHGLRRTNEDKRRVVMTLLEDKEWATWPLNQIAEHCKVSVGFVHKLYHSSFHNEKIEKPTGRTVQRNGTTYTMNTANIGKSPGAQIAPPASPANFLGFEDETDPPPAASNANTSYTMPGETEPHHAPTPDTLLSEPADPASNKMDVHYSSETPEWYTPPDIIDRVVDVLGAIDLDPCSNSHDTPNVPAAHHFTQADDGLAQWWQGRVYMNPPYGRALADWINKLHREYRTGHVTEAIALVPSRTDTQWFRQLRDYPRCFVWGRLRFSGMETGAPFPSMAVYLGTNRKRFVTIFGAIGDVYEVVA